MTLDLAVISWIWHQSTGSKRKKDKLDCIKIKSFCTLKDTRNRVKRQPMEWEKYHISDQGLMHRIKNSYNSTTRSKQPKKKWAKDLNRRFSKEDIEMDNKHIKKTWSASLITKEMKIKATMRYHFSYTRMFIIKTSK